jgi:hypothetical protein
MPIASVVALYYIQDDILRLGITAAASSVFALALALMTNARMVEIFAATSA